MNIKKLKIRRKKHVIQEYVEAILFAFVVAMIIRNYTFQNFKIPSSSMESTLMTGDFLVANKVKYFFTKPKRGDIVTFRYPDDPEVPPASSYASIYPPIYWNKTTNTPAYYAKKNIVKRVIGMPGDTIRINYKQLYINGKPYQKGYEQFVDRYTLKNTYTDPNIYHEFRGNRDNLEEFVVPAGKYFVMGDNRDNSLDSRYWGFLEEKDITGTPSMVFFSIDDKTGKLRWDRFFKLVKWFGRTFIYIYLFA